LVRRASTKVHLHWNSRKHPLPENKSWDEFGGKHWRGRDLSLRKDVSSGWATGKRIAMFVTTLAFILNAVTVIASRGAPGFSRTENGIHFLVTSRVISIC
jgi:hypothetical protein